VKFLIDIPDNEIGGDDAKLTAASLEQFMRQNSPTHTELTVVPMEGMRVVAVVDGGTVDSAYHSPELSGIELVIVDHDVMADDYGLDGDERDEVESQQIENLVQGSVTTATQAQYLNYYQHEDCPEQPGVAWTDQWSCMCNDRCPACNAEITPFRSEEIS
jgi:hypothetical protein